MMGAVIAERGPLRMLGGPCPWPSGLVVDEWGWSQNL